MAAVAAVHLQDLDQHALARLIVLCGIHPPLIGKFPQRDVALRAEQINKDAGPDNGDNPGLCTDSFIDLIVAVPVGTEIILPPLECHSLQTAGSHYIVFLVDAP